MIAVVFRHKTNYLPDQFRTCIPDGNPKPVISLILLAIILGLPGVLIVVTSRKLVYVGWYVYCP